jgi:hypothetical protein
MKSVITVSDLSQEKGRDSGELREEGGQESVKGPVNREKRCMGLNGCQEGE